MMQRLRRYDVFRFAQNGVAPVGRNDAMFAPMCPQANIIRVANIIRRSRHHLPKANIIQKTDLCLGRQKCVFCCLKRDKRCLNRVKNEQKVSNKGNKNYFFLFFICLTMTTPNKITDIKRRGPVQT